MLYARGEVDSEIEPTDESIELMTNSPTIVFFPYIIDRIRLEQVSAILSMKRGNTIDLCTRTSYHASPRPLEAVTVIGNALGASHDQQDIDDFSAFLERLAVLDELKALPDGLYTELTGPILTTMSAEARFAIAGAYCCLRPQRYLFFDLKGFDGLNSEFQMAFLAELKDSYVFIVDTTPASLFTDQFESILRRISNVVLLIDEKTVRCASIAWLEENLAEITTHMTRLFELSTPAEERVTTDDEDLDEIG